MKKNYFFSAAALLGAAAMLSPVANAQGWRNMNHLLPNVSKATGWSGVVTGGNGERGVGEIFAGAGKVYQVVRDLPAGEYTLTANAFYRDGASPEGLHVISMALKPMTVISLSTIQKLPLSLFSTKMVSPKSLFGMVANIFGMLSPIILMQLQMHLLPVSISTL